MKEQVLGYLLKRPGIFYGPTHIGLGLGKNYDQASSSVMRSLKSLVKDGLVVKNERAYGAVIPEGKCFKITGWTEYAKTGSVRHQMDKIPMGLFPQTVVATGEKASNGYPIVEVRSLSTSGLETAEWSLFWFKHEPLT